jgi:hypothetical protein
MLPGQRRERKLSPALVTQPPTPHGPLQRLSGPCDDDARPVLSCQAKYSARNNRNGAVATPGV